MVSKINQNANPGTTSSSPESSGRNPSFSERDGTSVPGEITVDGLSLIRTGLAGGNISTRAQEIMLKSWREGTQKQYRVYLQKWISFCRGRHTDPVQLTVAAAVDFLTELLDSGLGYSGLNTARCALSTFTVLEGNISIGSHPLVKRFLKAAYQIRPSFPRYQFMWDTSIVLTYLRDLPPVQEISLKTLTLKLTMLCALVTGQRCQSLHLMNLEQLFMGPEFCKFVINDIVKQSAPGRTQPELVIPIFQVEPKLCVYTCLCEYIKRTKPLRGEETRLFISYIKPHKWVSKDTIARWVKIVMQQAGVDERLFKPHSTRAASTSKAFCANVPLASIIKAGSWKSECVFRKFYNKPIESAQDFAQSILTSND